MYDTRNDALAQTIVCHSLHLKEGERVWIRGGGLITEPLVSALVKAAKEQGAFALYRIDYRKMSIAMEPLKSLMERTDRVRIIGPGETNLSFSIKGIPVVSCAGKRNIPDGEIYTAPVKNSVNGVIAYNVSSIHDGFEFTDIRFRFKNGRIVEASANDTHRINHVLNIDEGARYIGEFAMGVNPFIEKPINNALFDEKIRGSLHLTPGNCYENANNSNNSALHWDIVLLQEKPYGGEIWFDDVVIRKDGRFVLPELIALNPENLA